MKPMVTPPAVCFLHINKTAGSSLASLIRLAYPLETALPVYVLKDLVAMAPAAIRRYSCWTGHFGTALLPLLSGDVVRVTMLRDPFERTVSHLRYWRRRTRFEEMVSFLGGDEERAHLIRDGDIGLALKDTAIAEGLRDFQTRFLGVNLDIDTLRGTEVPYHAEMTAFRATRPMEEIAQAASRLLESADVVGITERFEESARLVCERLGIPLPEAWPRERVSSERQSLGERSYRSSGEFTPETVARIDALTVHDRRIYAQAKTLLEKQLARQALAPRPTTQTRIIPSQPGRTNSEPTVQIASVFAFPGPSAPASTLRLAFLSSSPEEWTEFDGLWCAAVERLISGNAVRVFKTAVDWSHPQTKRLQQTGCPVQDIQRMDLPLPQRALNQLLRPAWRRNWYEIHQYTLGKALEDFAPHLVIISQHANSDGVWLADICRLRRLPYVLLSRVPAWTRWPYDELRPAMRASFQAARRCYFAGSDGQELTEEMMGLRLTNASVLPPNAKHPARRPLPWPVAPDNRLCLACVAPLVVTEGGQDVLLQVLAREKWRSREVFVSFFGDGINRQGLVEMALLLDVTNVSFGGDTIEPQDLFKDQHALLLASPNEDSGRVIQQALALGRPVIAPASGVARALVSDGETGFLASSDSEDALDQALEGAWLRRRDWPQMGFLGASRMELRAPGSAIEILVRDLVALCDHEKIV